MEERLLGLVREGGCWLASVQRCWLASVKRRSPGFILDGPRPRLKQPAQNGAAGAAEGLGAGLGAAAGAARSFGAGPWGD